ncbi:MAG: flagellin, partial [Pseudomonadota bacterium]
MSSILTNNSAMVALQTLKSINMDLAKTQSMISTGKEVGSARDNSAVWAISKVMESDVKGFKAISESLSLGSSSVAVARNGAETVTDLLNNRGDLVSECVNVSLKLCTINVLTLRRDDLLFHVVYLLFGGINGTLGVFWSWV